MKPSSASNIKTEVTYHLVKYYLCTQCCSKRCRTNTRSFKGKKGSSEKKSVCHSHKGAQLSAFHNRLTVPTCHLCSLYDHRKHRFYREGNNTGAEFGLRTRGKEMKATVLQKQHAATDSKEFVLKHLKTYPHKCYYMRSHTICFFSSISVDLKQKSPKLCPRRTSV